MRYFAILLLVVSMASAVVMDGTVRYADCAYFDNLISVVLGNNNSYLTLIGADNGYSTYSVLAPNDYWDGGDDCYLVLHTCFLAAGFTSAQSSYTSDNCNVVFADRMYTMSTYNCRQLTTMRDSDEEIFAWIRSHSTWDDIGTDDLMY